MPQDFLKNCVFEVYIRETDIPTSFAESRDWFELFFDDVFAPPKLFNIVIQWVALGPSELELSEK